jgi:hypothetical protein
LSKILETANLVDEREIRRAVLLRSIAGDFLSLENTEQRWIIIPSERWAVNFAHPGLRDG